MQRARFGNVLVAVVVVLASAVGLVAAPAHVAFAKPAAQGVAPHDQIILIESNGRIRIDDPLSEVTIWDSGTDISWVYLAAGDFNGDGDAEIAAIRGSTLKIFDPFPSSQVLGQITLDGGRQFRFLVTGDFDRDGRDEIAVTHTEIGYADTLKIYDGGASGTTWAVARSESFGYQWRAMAAGDMNNDGFDDLALARWQSNLLKVYSGYNWSNLAESSYNFPWLSLGIGNLSGSYPADEMALTREGRCGSTNIDSLILFRLSSGFLLDLTPDVHYYYCPAFSSLSLGDVDGDASHDAEILLLRNPGWDTTSLLLVNPAGPAMRNFELATGYGGSAWSLVRTGDLDGDGKAEVVILRSNAYRMYMQPDQNDLYQEVPGSFRISPSGYDYPTIAIANVGVQLPILQVSPTTLSFDQNTTSHAVAISNLGAGGSVAWQAQVTEGSTWLRAGPPTSGTTPGQLNISVDLSTAEPNVTLTGTVRITAAGAANSPQDVSVTLRITDAGLVITPKQLRLVQKIGDPPAEGRLQITRPSGIAAEWVATAVPLASSASVVAALKSGQAEVTPAGVSLPGGVAVPPPDWLTFGPDHDITPSIMIVHADLPGPGLYDAMILIVAIDPRIPNRVQGVTVQAEQVKGFAYLPLMMKQ
jgi:hypothetical protein